MKKINYNNVPAPGVYLVSDPSEMQDVNQYDEDGNLYPIGTIFYLPSQNYKFIVSDWQYDEETGEPFGIVMECIGEGQDPLLIPQPDSDDDDDDQGSGGGK